MFEYTLKINQYGRSRYRVSVKNHGNKYWNDNEQCLYLENLRQIKFLEENFFLKKMKDKLHFPMKIIHE